MRQNNNNIISKIILGQSIGSVRLIIVLFTACSAALKLLYNEYLPYIVDIDFVRWGMIMLGALYFIATFYRFKSRVVISYFSFSIYLMALLYALWFTLINYFDPSVVTILILIIGASTIVINNIAYYWLQSGLIISASFLVFFNSTLSSANTVAFFNLLIAIGVFAIVNIVRLKLISNIKHSYSYLEKLQVLSIIANKKGEIVFVSPSVQHLLGYKPTELLQNGWWKTTNLSEGWLMKEHILNYPNIIPKDIVSIERSMSTKNGNTIWLNWVNSILPNGSYLGIGLNITKYKKDTKDMPIPASKTSNSLFKK